MNVQSKCTYVGEKESAYLLENDGPSVCMYVLRLRIDGNGIRLRLTMVAVWLWRQRVTRGSGRTV
jgi:hypothetical protein